MRRAVVPMSAATVCVSFSFSFFLSPWRREAAFSPSFQVFLLTSSSMTFLCVATPTTTLATASAGGCCSAQTQAFSARRRSLSGGDRVLSAKRHTIITAGRQQWHEHDDIPEAASDATNGGQGDATFDPRAFRRALNKSPNYNRRVANDADSIELMKEHGVGYSEQGIFCVFLKERKRERESSTWTG